MQPLDEPAGSPGRIVKLDRKTGKILGYVPMTEKAGLHSVEDAGAGQPMTDIGNKVSLASLPTRIPYCTEHSFSMVLIEVMVKATEAELVLAKVLELVLREGDSFPITSTCCPR